MPHRPTITLVGRAHSLAFAEGTATWSIAIRRSADPDHLTDFNLRGFHSRVLEQFERMDEGQLIGVIAEVPPKRQLQPGVPLTVTRLEILGKPVATAEG